MSAARRQDALQQEVHTSSSTRRTTALIAHQTTLQISRGATRSRPQWRRADVCMSQREPPNTTRGALVQLSTWRRAPPCAAHDALMQRSMQSRECAVIGGQADVCTSQREPPQAVDASRRMCTSQCAPPHDKATGRHSALVRRDATHFAADCSGMGGRKVGSCEPPHPLPQSAVAGPS